jgi:hypothetical protein
MCKTAPMDTSEITWKHRPQASVMRLTATGGNGLARVSAEWLISGTAIPHAPSRVTVNRARTNDRPAERGVTTAVMRDAEPLIGRMMSELPGQLGLLDLPDPMAAVAERAQALPSSPRGNPTFYGDLLAVFDAMEAAGVTDPVKTLCRITGRPEGTVKTQLRIARRDTSQHQLPLDSPRSSDDGA